MYIYIYMYIYIHLEYRSVRQLKVIIKGCKHKNQH